MNWDYIGDGLDPRGAEYSATRRAARSARNTEQAMDDMLELAAAPDERSRQAIANQIRARRQGEARRGARWTRLDVIASVLLVTGIGYYMVTPSADNAPTSAVTHDAPANVSQVPDTSRAPVRSACARAKADATARAKARGDVDPDNRDIVYLSDADSDKLAADNCL